MAVKFKVGDYVYISQKYLLRNEPLITQIIRIEPCALTGNGFFYCLKGVAFLHQDQLEAAQVRLATKAERVLYGKVEI